jgi:hypothetical protein
MARDRCNGSGRPLKQNLGRNSYCQRHFRSARLPRGRFQLSTIRRRLKINTNFRTVQDTGKKCIKHKRAGNGEHNIGCDIISGLWRQKINAHKIRYKIVNNSWTAKCRINVSTRKLLIEYPNESSRIEFASKCHARLVG